MIFLFNPQGRVSRKDYWFKFIFLFFGILFIALAIDVFLLLEITSGIPIFTLALYLFILWPAIAVTTKRLHDRSMSGWWQLIPPIVIVVAFLPGHPGRNKYGQNPLETDDSDQLDEVFS